MLIKIIRPSSYENPSLMEASCPSFKKENIDISYQPKKRSSKNFSSYSLEDRLEELIEAISNPNYDYILCARGGYGASDLLSCIPWNKLKKISEKIIIGASDISALHCAFYTKLHWKGLHAPMPATDNWNKNPSFIKKFLKFLKNDAQSFKLPLKSLTNKKANIEGKLFGGCFSVLSSLIGTPYFPNLKNHIVFLEDINESFGSLNRYLNQWIDSKSLTGVKAIVLGNFQKCGNTKETERIYQNFVEKTNIPCFYSKYFGHIPQNYPLMNGAKAQIKDNYLIWKR